MKEEQEPEPEPIKSFAEMESIWRQSCGPGKSEVDRAYLIATINELQSRINQIKNRILTHFN